MCLVLSDLVAYSTFGWGRSLYLFVVYSSKFIFGGGRDCQGTVEGLSRDLSALVAWTDLVYMR